MNEANKANIITKNNPFLMFRPKAYSWLSYNEEDKKKESS